MTLYLVSAMQAASPGHGPSAAARSNNSYQPSVPQPTAVPAGDCTTRGRNVDIRYTEAGILSYLPQNTTAPAASL